MAKAPPTGTKFIVGPGLPHHCQIEKLVAQVVADMEDLPEGTFEERPDPRDHGPKSAGRVVSAAEDAAPDEKQEMDDDEQGEVEEPR